MEYIPMPEDKKAEMIGWLENLAGELSNKPENSNVKDIFTMSEIGDVATCKDVVGNFLALLTNSKVDIP